LKFVLAFDSFKGNMSAREVCETVERGIRSARPDAETVILPMADGGEGTAEAMMAALGGEWIPMTVTGPLPSMKVDAGFAWLPESKTAVVEMATASGLPLLKPAELNPMKTTTFGTGELIYGAIRRGAEKILLTVGGSATVDGGLGAAAALGWRFLDEDGNDVILCGEGVARVEKIVPPGQIIPPMDVLCDVTNPLCGPNGAAQVFGPQKGATPEMVTILDRDLKNFADKIFQTLEKEVCDLPGAGAAGGLSAGAVAFMNGKLVPGIDAVMKTVGLADALDGADWVLTGEGKFDSQSVQGKVVDGVQRLANKAGAKTGVIAGCVKLSEPEWRNAGVEWVETLQPEGMSTEESISRSRELLFEAAASFARDL
jgi:glycerate kinase